MNKVRTQIPYYTLLILMVCCLACGSKTEVTETESVPTDGFQSFQIDLKGDKKPFVDLIQSIEITRLEETEESLLGYVSRVEFHEDKMVIFGSSNDGTIYIYSKKGEFISKFNRKGDGPEEYSRWTDVWLENGLIGIHNSGKSINQYDLEGNFISRDRLDELAEHVHPYKSGYALDKNTRYTQDSLMFSLVTLDDQMKLDKTFLPFDKYPVSQVAFSPSTLSTLGDDLFYLRLMSDTVYRITNDSAVPFIHYDFQEDWYFQPGIEEVTGSVYEAASRKEQVWFIYSHIGQSYIYLYTTLGPRKNYAFFIDRETKQSVSIESKTSTGERLDLSPIRWNGNQFLIALNSIQFIDLLNQLDQEQYSFTEGTTLEEIESSENPVLVSVKFK